MGEEMGKQSARQAARRTALDAQVKMLAKRAEREKRLSALGVSVMVALAERDSHVNGCELRAGERLVEMVEIEGVSLSDAVSWCGLGISRREANRLLCLAVSRRTAKMMSEGPGSSTTVNR